MVLVRGSNDINRECLLLADGACSTAAAERALVALATADDGHLRRCSVAVLPGPSSSTESFRSLSLDVSYISCLARPLWSISLVVHSRRHGRADRVGTARGPYVRFASVPSGPSGVFGHGSDPIRGDRQPD